jgi:hypothetical protein
VIAQALSSSSHTIPPHQGLHSTHCYFLLPASGSQAITYAVDRLRDGKSYATRLVKGMQGQKVVFVLMASYAVGGIEGEIKGETPFGFVPTLSDGKAKGKGKGKGAVSHSLTFTVEPSGKREEEGEGDGKEAEGKELMVFQDSCLDSRSICRMISYLTRNASWRKQGGRGISVNEGKSKVRRVERQYKSISRLVQPRYDVEADVDGCCRREENRLSL